MEPNNPHELSIDTDLLQQITTIEEDGIVNMSSRIKRLVELALKVESNSISTAENGELCSTSKKSNSENSFCEDYLEKKLGKEGNPWKEFNEWKEKQIEINGNVESNHNEKSTDFIDSSTSWIPDEANNLIQQVDVRQVFQKKSHSKNCCNIRRKMIRMRL
ncbi:hypothetical protein JTB14_038450 [Gonioctena quinquepunctata]|nr:hypothetical protein JTB14_038450 [Gonioctena quinquepunctata]